MECLKYLPLGISARLTTQVAHVCETIAATPELADGYNAVGFSQGAHMVDLSRMNNCRYCLISLALNGSSYWDTDSCEGRVCCCHYSCIELF